LAKKLAETKIIARVNRKKIKAKKLKKRLLSCLLQYEAATIVYQNLSITAEVGGFLATAEVLLKCYE
jgi:hypothetical protein